MEISRKSAVISFAVTIPFLAAQGLSPDEVKVTSRSYVPRTPNAFRVDTKLVDVAVIVRDGRSHAVSGLTRENFKVYDNGKEREIANFAVDSAATATEAAEIQKADSLKASTVRPRFIALYIDDVNAKDGRHFNDLKQTQDAAVGFVKDALQPGVQIGIFTASGAQTLDFTADSAKAIETIGLIQAHPHLSEAACITPFLAYSVVVRRDSTAVRELADRCHALPQQAEETWRQAKATSAATLESIEYVAARLATMPGARVLLLASSGFLTGTIEDQRDRIVGRALKAGVVINALDSKGVYAEMPASLEVPLAGPSASRGLEAVRYNTANVGQRTETMNEPLAALAEGTGGSFFHNSNDLHAGFLQIGTPPETVYRLSFRLPDGVAGGTYHKLKVTVVHAPHESVQARPGYFAPAEKPQTEPVVESSKFDQEVMAADTVDDFPVDVSAQFGKPSSGGTTLFVVANVDISKLHFTKQGDRLKQTVRFVSALKDAQGTIVAAKEATMDLSLKESTYNRLAKTGLNAKLALQAPPGLYSVREVVEESADRKLSCSTHSIEIP